MTDGRQGTRMTAAIAQYDALLRNGLAQATHDAIVAGQEARGLVYAGRPLCDGLRPCLLDAGAYAALRRAAEIVNRGLCAVVQATRTDACLREQLGLDPLAAALAGI